MHIPERRCVSALAAELPESIFFPVSLLKRSALTTCCTNSMSCYVALGVRNKFVFTKLPEQ